MIPFDSLAIDPTGCNLIEASAGTGKTYAIASLYVRLIIEDKQCKPENILVVTFTEAATKELRDRIRKRLREARDAAGGEGSRDPFLTELLSSGHPGCPGSDVILSRLDRALQSFDCAAISTIHGFCSQALQENAFESGSLFDTELVTNQKPLINQIVDDFWRIRFFAADAPLLPLAETMKWSPETFAAFLKGKLTNPALKIVPAFAPVEIDAIRCDCRTAYDTLCSLWLKERPEIAQILLEHPGLSRSQKNYQPVDAVPELLAGMDSFIRQGTPYAFFAGSQKLTASYMNKKDVRLKKCDPPEHTFFTLWDELVTLVSRMAVTLYAELIEFAKSRLPERKNALNVRFFDDLLVDLQRAFTGQNGAAMAERMRGKYRAALIDEFQDTDQIQYKIFRALFTEGSVPLFLIGDPKQAIYSFRGADIYAYLEAKDDVPKEHHHTMTLNWRSSAGLVEAVNHLFSMNREHPFVLDGLSYPAVNVPVAAAGEAQELFVAGRDASPLQIWFFSREGSEGKAIPLKRAHPAIVQAVTDEIVVLLRDASEGKTGIGTELHSRAVVPGDIAVIVRGHKQAAMIYDSLQLRGVPAVVRSDQCIFQTPEALELRTILNAVAEPGHEARVRASLATSVMGSAAHEIARTFAADGEAEWEKRLHSFREYHTLWKNYGFMTMFRAFLESEGVRARLLSLPGGERSITNLLHCGELLHAEASASHLGVDALSTWFSEQITTPPEGEEHQIRLESDEKAVKILTIHVSKGLEFPIVFCPFLWGGVFDGGETAVAHEGFELVADFGSDNFEQHRRAALDEGLAENVRLLYVALTRAKYRCYVSWGRFRHTESSALAYLFHAPEKTPDSSPYENLVKAMATLDDDAMIEKIRSVTSEGRINLVVDPADGCAAEFTRGSDCAAQLTCRTMTGTIASEWRVASFSSLVDGHETPPEFPDHDHCEEIEQSKSDEAPSGNSFFAFPKGADPGTFLHSIFEEVDFTSVSDAALAELVAKAMKRSPTYEKQSATVQAMLTTVLNAELPGGLRLSALQPGSWVQEMEFYFPLKSIEPKLLVNFFKEHGITAPVDLERMAESLNFQNVRGMLLGFIDLLFCHEGRYYILDWKSNFLGNQPENYTPANLARDMERKLYPLQYLIYTVAVHRYLERRIPDYRYETHFGGAIYLYLRGIDNAHPRNGIYFDKPDAGLVRGLTQCLIAIEEVHHA
ncbi:MAG TPA: exodeoxyribonuclease V subunit beta [Desulfuromonadales bacterium]|nr:exodeoxyribonuclease V subunit beta [Desulfuromonadales bacterium]